MDETTNPDIDTLASESSVITLESGFEVTVQRLKTRQTMRLLKILTRGASDALMTIKFGEDTSTEDFTGSLLAAVVLSIPEAEDETIDFIKGMVLPVGYIESKRLSIPEQEINAELDARLDVEMEDPELGDLISIAERVVTIEAPHIQALGKRLALLFQVQQKSLAAKSSASSKKSVKG